MEAREAIGERTRDALCHKKSNGERVGNIHYGYRLAKDGRHLEPEPKEQAVVAMGLAALLSKRIKGRA
jgi:DNA invertase Pin-like site-specific DNA recombinase